MLATAGGKYKTPEKPVVSEQSRNRIKPMGRERWRRRKELVSGNLRKGFVGEGGREGEREERWRERERGGERERDRFLNSTEGKTAFRTWIDKKSHLLATK